MARTLVKQSPSVTKKTPALVLSLLAPLCTRKHFGGSRSRPVTLSTRECLYHTSARIKYADIVHDENKSESKESVGSSAVQQQLDRAYSLVSVVERDGEHAEECARDAVDIFARVLVHEQLSKDEQASCRDGMGVCYTKLGDIAAAERVLQQGVEAHPTFAPLWLHLGEVMQQYGQHLEAVMMFTKFVELSKEFYHTTHTQYEDVAVAYHYTTRARYTDNVHLLCAAFFKRAVSYIRVQEETMALTDLWLIVDTAHSPQWTARAYLAIAQLARLRGDWHQARNLATKSIEAAAQDPPQSRERAQILSQAHHVRAVCYEALDDDARAEQDHVLADFYFRETAFKAAELSVYPSQDSVFILDRQLLVHQTLRLADYSKYHPHNVSSIAWHKHHGMLAIAVTAEILLFRCTDQAAVPQWQYVTKLAVPEAKNNSDAHVLLEWRGVTARDTCLLVSHAHTLHLFELSTWFESRVSAHPAEISEHAPIWQGPLPRESVSRMECSPCGRYLAVSGAHHCCVKLWYRASNTRTGLNFLYLPHSRAVVDMQWRENSRGRAVLLTLSADGCVNLWTESPFTERVNFTLSLVIDEGEGYGVTKHYSATTTFGGIIGVSWLSDPVREDPESKEEGESRANSHALKQTGHAMTRNIQERQGNTTSVTSGGSQDWLLGVQKDGGVLVWKVKGLNEHPLQAPIVVLLSCIKAVLPPQLDWLHLAVSPQLFAFPSEPHSYAPSLFNLYTLAPLKRVISGWSISQSSTRISGAINRLHGHDAPIAHLAAHQRLPLVASLDQHHRLIVWRVQDQHVIDAPLLCTHLVTMEHCRTFCWDLTEPVIYTVIGNEGLFMNEIALSADEHTVAPMTAVTQLTRVSVNTDWSQLLCLPAVTHIALEPHTTPRSVHLAALSKSGDAIKVYRITRAAEVTVLLLCSHESDEEVYTHLAAPQHVLHATTAPCALFTGSESGMVHGWMLTREDEDDDVTLHSVLHFQAHSAPLTQLRVNYLGRLATMARDELKVWELESSVPQYRHESLIDAHLTQNAHTAQQSTLSIGAALSPLISVSQHNAVTAQHTAPLDLDWYTTPEGHSLLAVLTRDSVRLYELGCNRTQLEAFTPKWTLLHTIALGATAHRGVVWSANGVLVSAQERQLSVVSKWSELGTGTARAVSVLAQLAQSHRPLPVYHPKKLVQYLMTGQFDRLALIFKQLFMHLSDDSKRNLSFDLPLDSYLVKEREQHSAELAPSTAPESVTPVKVKPAPTKSQSAQQSYDFLDDPYDKISFSTMDDDVDIEVSDSDDDETREHSDEDDWGLSARKNNANSAVNTASASEASAALESDKPDELSAAEASALVDLLTRRELEGVTRRDQMFVLAVLDLFTSGMLAKQHLHTSQAWTPVGCAIRFQVQVKIGLYMSRFAPQAAKATSAATAESELALSSLDWCWALHAGEHEALVNLTVPAEPTWATLRALGVALWCQHVPTLRTLAERVAKSEYLRNKNAEDCALYYLALRKKVALQQLYKTQKDETLVKFLANDFEHERWKTAAQKNAYVLLSKQRYHLAAAFFLLADQLRDAVSICVQKLNDYHLALFIARLFEGDLGEISRDVLVSHVLPIARNNADLGLASLSHWLLRDYEAALLSLVGAKNTVPTHWSEPLAPDHVLVSSVNESVTTVFAPGVAHLFRYLQQHRHLKEQDYTAHQALLQRRVLYAYLHAGCTHLTLAPLVHDALHRGPAPLIDAHLRLQVAIQLAALRVDEARRVKSEDMSGVVQLIDMLAQQLTVHRTALFEALIKYSGEQHYLREEMLLTVEHSNAPLDALRLLLKTSRRISALLRIIPHTQLSRAQATRLDQQSRELHACAWLYKQRYRPQLQARSVPVIDARAYHQDTLKVRGTLSNSASNVSTLAQDEPASKEEEKAMIEIFAASRLGACMSAMAAQDYQCLYELLFNGLDLNHIRPLDAGVVVVPVTRPRSDSASSSEQDDSPAETEQVREVPQHMTGLSSDEDLDTLPPDLPRVTDDTTSDEEDREQIHTRVASELDKLHLDARVEQWCQHVLQLMIVREFTEQLELLLNQVFKNPKNVTVIKQLHKWLTEFELRVAVTPELLLHFKITPITVPGANEDESSVVVPSLASTDWLVIEHVMRKARVLRQQRYAQLVWQRIVSHKSAVKYLGKTDYLKQDQQIIHTQRTLTRVNGVTRTLTFSEPSTAFKSKESILSLCVNPRNEKNLVIATHKGLSELTLRAHQFNTAGTTEVQLTPRTASTLANSSSTLTAPAGRKVLSASNSPLVPHQNSRSPRGFTDHSTPASPSPVHRGTDNHGHSWVESHPHDPFYIAGGFDGSVTLWQFGFEVPLCTYKTTGHAKITRIRFNWNGTKFAVGDQSGYLNVWRFDSSLESLEPYLTIQCHTKRVTDLAFINSGSFIATAGVTNGIGVVSFWDTLCLPTKQEVYRLVPDHVFGANVTGKISSLLWVSNYQLLVLGTKRGQVRLWNPRTMAPLPSPYKDALGASSSSLSFSSNNLTLSDSSGNIMPTVKQSSIRALEVVDRYLIQGSRNGSVTVWDLDALAHSATVVSVAAWPEVHRVLQMTRSGLETNGVTAMFTSNKHLYTTGADGRVVERKFRRQLMPNSHQ